MAPEAKERMIKHKDVRLLRECLAWIHKRSPTSIQQKIDMEVRRYAANVGEYCDCSDYVFVKKEGKSACLDCGKRFEVKVKSP